MQQLMVGQDEVKALIWRLDAALAIFNGVDWMENVGRVARLKASYFRSIELAGGDLSHLGPVELKDLNLCLDLLDHKGSTATLCAEAFDKAVSLITLLLSDGAALQGE